MDGSSEDVQKAETSLKRKECPEEADEAAEETDKQVKKARTAAPENAPSTPVPASKPEEKEAASSPPKEEEAKEAEGEATEDAKAEIATEEAKEEPKVEGFSGRLFQQSYTNPFAEIAKCTTSWMSASTLPNPPPVDEGGAEGVAFDLEKQKEEEAEQQLMEVVGKALFPGEEDEDLIFEEAAVILLKSIPVPIGDTPPEGSEETQKTEMRFKRRGEGVVRVLQHKETKNCRVVMRQKSTWKILLNSPGSLVRQPVVMSDYSGLKCPVKFLALDEQETLSAFCMKFSGADAANSFLAFLQPSDGEEAA